jgi:hypothetical protein
VSARDDEARRRVVLAFDDAINATPRPSIG